MNENEIEVCVGCLASEVRMYSMKDNSIIEAYRLLIGIQELPDAMPQTVCCDCATGLHRVTVLRERCLHAYVSLRDIILESQQITLESIKCIDRGTKPRLLSPCSLSRTVGTTFRNYFENDKEAQTTAILCEKSNHQDIEIKAEYEDSLKQDETKIKCEESVLEVSDIIANESDDDKPIGALLDKVLQDKKKKKVDNTKKRRGDDDLKKQIMTTASILKPKWKRKDRIEETMIIKPLTQEEQMSRFLSTRNESARYKCQVCLKGHNEERAFANHMMKHDLATGKYICDMCKYRYKSRYRIAKHLAHLHRNEYVCKLCGEKFYNRMAAGKHHYTHKGKTYECDICGFKSKHPTTHLSHVRLRHASEHVCAACGVPAVSLQGLRQHLRLTHQITDSKTMTATGPYCALCSVQFISRQAWTRHVLISPKHTHERDTIANGCPFCGESFATQQELKTHRRALHKQPKPKTPRPYVPRQRVEQNCVKCGEMVSSLVEYRRHFRARHPADVFPAESAPSHMCDQCGKPFANNWLLSLHQNIHTGEKNYKCTLCGKAFYSPAVLRQHGVSHSEQRPHQCQVCRKAFKLKSALARHTRIHTGEKAYVCHICNKTFACTSSGRLHIRNVHHREPPPSI